MLEKSTWNKFETAEAVISKERRSVDSESNVSPFFAMLREKRDMIAGSPLKDGDLSILRYSKALSEETLEHTNQEATCRTAVTDTLTPNSRSPRTQQEFGRRIHFRSTEYLYLSPPTVPPLSQCSPFENYFQSTRNTLKTRIGFQLPLWYSS